MDTRTYTVHQGVISVFVVDLHTQQPSEVGVQPLEHPHTDKPYFRDHGSKLEAKLQGIARVVQWVLDYLNPDYPYPDIWTSAHITISWSQREKYAAVTGVLLQEKAKLLHEQIS